MLTRTHTRDSALARRITQMKATLERATADNSDVRRVNADLRREIARLRAENRRLQDALEQARNADRPRRVEREMTAGTCVGPRRSR
jgi:regulator of replication initiation timing